MQRDFHCGLRSEAVNLSDFSYDEIHRRQMQARI